MILYKHAEFVWFSILICVLSIEVVSGSYMNVCAHDRNPKRFRAIRSYNATIVCYASRSEGAFNFSQYFCCSCGTRYALFGVIYSLFGMCM